MSIMAFHGLKCTRQKVLVASIIVIQGHYMSMNSVTGSWTTSAIIGTFILHTSVPTNLCHFSRVDSFVQSLINLLFSHHKSSTALQITIRPRSLFILWPKGWLFARMNLQWTILSFLLIFSISILTGTKMNVVPYLSHHSCWLTLFLSLTCDRFTQLSVQNNSRCP